MSEPVNVLVRPALMYLHGKTYAIGGGAWIEVPEGTTMADLPRYMVHKPYESTPAKPDDAPDRWKVKGSTGNTYTVTKSAKGYNCSCPGYQFRRACKHSTQIEKEQGKPNELK